MQTDETIISILGTRYSYSERFIAEDECLKKCDGYCDKTAKRIVVKLDMDTDLEDIEVYRKKVMRHEILHAFLYESGLHENWEHKQWGQDETFIDWVAIQFPKIFAVYKELGCL